MPIRFAGHRRRLEAGSPLRWREKVRISDSVKEAYVSGVIIKISWI